jgi:hypothetical protein
MTFKENLLQKIELERLASQVIASCGSEESTRPVDKEAMRSLLELSPYQYQRERDLDLYIKPEEGEGVLKMILILDNKLPIFRSTVKDVVTRRSPRTLEMWNFKTVHNILVDSDINISTRAKSVETVLMDAVAQLDLTYTDADIKNMTREGMAWLAGNNGSGVEKSLTLFATLLGYQEPPDYLGLGNIVCYGVLASGQDNDTTFGPLVLSRPDDNTMAWINESFSQSDRKQIEFLRSVAAGESSVSLTGDVVFETLQANVLEQPGRVLSV